LVAEFEAPGLNLLTFDWGCFGKKSARMDGTNPTRSVAVLNSRYSKICNVSLLPSENGYFLSLACSPIVEHARVSMLSLIIILRLCLTKDRVQPTFYRQFAAIELAEPSEVIIINTADRTHAEEYAGLVERERTDRPWPSGSDNVQMVDYNKAKQNPAKRHV
jgi:hypothetical protein